MEGSKAFSKDFMRRHNIPTAEYRNFTVYEDAKAYLASIDHDIVLKADGLAAGKGVVIPTSKEEALEALEQIMVAKEFGEAGMDDSQPAVEIWGSSNANLGLPRQ